ncbi:MAG: hypothetical protein ABI895_11385 [Deltaproteobacteria bacterium]
MMYRVSCSETTVSIAAADGGQDVFDYRVEADLLQWREPETGQLLVLRRQSPAPQPGQSPEVA